MVIVVSLRRGLTDPTSSNLSQYELGWAITNKRLFINDGGTIKRINSIISLNGAVNYDPSFYAPQSITANRVLKTKTSWDAGSDPFEYIAIDSSITEDSTNLITSGAVYTSLTSLQSTINTALNNKVEKSGDIMTGTLIVPTLKLSTTIDDAGSITFNDTQGVPEITLSENVTLSIGIDSILKVYNDTGETLVDGQFVYPIGNINGITKVALGQADSLLTSENIIGTVTEPIPNLGYGFINTRGFVGNLIIDPAVYNLEDKIYLSPTIPGGFTKQKPTAPDYVVELGYINKLSTNNTTTNGEIRVLVHVIPSASNISYDNSDADIQSQSVKGALDELSLTKANVGDLASNIALYPTTASSDIVIYNRMVKDINDEDYDEIAVNVSTGAITVTDQLVGQLIADENLFVGNPGTINITTIGNIRRTTGNNNQYAAFYFKLFKRNQAGTETLIATSNETPDVRPLTNNIYEQFSTSALLSNATFISTDRIVIRYYANLTGNVGAEYEFQFGGANPVRTLLPIPLNVIPAPIASAIITNTTNFGGILSSQDTNVQLALDTLDDHLHDTRYVQLNDLQAGTLSQAEAGTDENQKSWTPKILKNAIQSLSTRIYVQSNTPDEPSDSDNLWFHV